MELKPVQVVGLTGSGKPARLHQEADFTAPWTALAAPTAGSWRGVGGSELFALCWEQKNLLALGHALHSFIRTNVVKQAIQQGIMQVRRHATRSCRVSPE